ncbi:MAG: ATPase [Tenericutes bacterium HGW-Tenericutes-5]|nr:MAG: ATPase [Tenericutes bacterium HGW-Tenericutes-5]
MRIAVLSGKGGTGKTFISVNLAYVIKNAAYLDCDVEEPNGDLYFKGDKIVKQVDVDIPVIDHDACTLCGKCADFCRFNALAIIIDKVRVFSSLCHSCGGCKLVCPVSAITEVKKSIGTIKETEFEGHRVIGGEMNIKEETGVKIIDEIIEISKDILEDVVIDCPPGNGCSVMGSIKNADYCLLVAEPTIFGLHNLKMVYELTQVFEKKVGIVINKASQHKIINDFAESENIEVLLEVPFDKELGLINSNGEIAAKDMKYKHFFEKLADKLLVRKV